MRKILSVFIAILFLINNLSFGLGVPNTSNDMDPDASGHTKKNMFMLADLKYLQDKGKGMISDEIIPDLTTKFKGAIDNPEFAKIDTTFLVRRLKKERSKITGQNPYQEQVLPGEEQNPIYKIDNLIDAFKYFRDNEAKISDKFLEIKAGYFPMAKGTFNPARIEKNPEGSKIPYTLIVHTDFIQMWAHIRANDVWFEKVFEDGEKRIISVAWGLFYRIAKHEMTDWRSGGRITKGGGHIHSKQGQADQKEHGVIESEKFANTIYGRYNYINDAILLWYMGAYMGSREDRYNNRSLERRLRGFFDTERVKEGKSVYIGKIFPLLRPYGREFEETILLAKGINQNFFSNAPYTGADKVKPVLLMPVIKPDKKAIKDYKERKRRNKHLDKDAMNMTGKKENKSGPLRILVLEDVPVLYDYIRDMLAEYRPDIIVRFAVNGKEGLEKLGSAEEKYDLILADSKMPEMNGIDFLRNVREDDTYREYKDTPVIVMASRDKEELDMIKTGIEPNGVYVKENPREELFALMDRALKPDFEKDASVPAEDQEPAEEEPVTVLLVDDEEGNRYVFSELLEGLHLGIEVVLAGDGAEAIEKIKEMKNSGKMPGIIITDMRMPVMNGLEFLNAFKELAGAKNTQVIPMSGFDSDMFKDLPKDELSIVGFLNKPFQIAALKELVEPALEKVREARKRDRSMIGVLSSYELPVDENYATEAIPDERAGETGPEVFSNQEREAIAYCADMFLKDKIEILFPQSVDLDKRIKKEFIEMNSKLENIVHDRYNENNIIEMLRERREKDDMDKWQKGKKEFKRIIVADVELSRKLKMLANENDNAELFRDVKVIVIDMPKDFVSNDQKLVQQSRMVMIAVLARLLNGDSKNDSRIGMVLKAILESSMDQVGLNDLLYWLEQDETEDKDVNDIIRRLNAVLSDFCCIRLTELLQREYRFVKKFWSYA